MTDYQNQLENCIQRLKKHKKISRKNKQLILKFKDEFFSLGMSVRRVLKYMQYLRRMAILLQEDFDQATKEGIKELVRKIDRMKKKGEDRQVSDYTKYDCKVMLKKFYKVMEGDNQEYPDKIKWLKPKLNNDKKKLPEELLTKEEVRKMIKAARHLRDKALVSVLYESGCRRGELMALRIKHIQFDDYGCILMVPDEGKTGARRVRLVTSTPYLSNWVSHHPGKEDPNSHLWVSIGTTNFGNQLSYNAIRKRLIDLAEKCEIKKKVNPHNFRHSRATHLANDLTEAQMCEYFGWKQGSRVPSVYIHMSGRDIDDAILGIHGIKRPEKKQDEKELEPVSCPRCKTQNEPDIDICSNCGMPLSSKAASEAKKRETKFMELMNPKVMENMIEKKVEELLKKKEKE